MNEKVFKGIQKYLKNDFIYITSFTAMLKSTTYFDKGCGLKIKKSNLQRHRSRESMHLIRLAPALGGRPLLIQRPSHEFYADYRT